MAATGCEGSNRKEGGVGKGVVWTVSRRRRRPQCATYGAPYLLFFAAITVSVYFATYKHTGRDEKMS
jgi:hypothetical protein